MRNFFTLWRRELGALFLSPVAYVTLAVFLLATGVTFMVRIIQSEGLPERPESVLFAALTLWLTFLIAVVSMRLFSEEKRSGTIETLMTVPVTEGQVVGAKFAGAMTFLAVAMAPTMSYPWLLAAMSPGIASVDGGAMLGGGLVLVLVSAFCLSLGLLISLLTPSQVVSGLCSLVAIWLALLLGWLISALPIGTGQIPEGLSVMSHIEDFARGSLDTRPIVLYGSGTVFLLFVAVRKLEASR